MQAVGLESSRPIIRQSGTESAAAARTVGAGQAEEPSRASPRPAAVALRRGLQNVDPQQNRRVASAQQTLEFLDAARRQLRDIETALTRRTPDGNAHEQIEERIQRFAELWNEKSRATGGLLDDRLEVVQDGVPRRRFTVRGLDLGTLRTGPRELLSFATGGRGRPEVTSVLIEPHLSADEIVRRFDRALAAAGIRASLDDGGELKFEVAEAAWPTVRDTLAVKGEGRRFPTGQFNKASAVPEPAAIRPQDWSIRDGAAPEDLQQQVRQADEHLRRAYLAVSGLLAQENNRLAAAASQDGASRADARWSEQFVRTFEAAASRGDYRVLAAAAPALMGLSRERVIAVLRSF